MADILSILRGGAQVAGAGVGGYAVDRQQKIKQAMDAARAERDAENDRVMNLFRTTQIDRMNAPPPPEIEREGGQLINVTEGTARPIEGYQAPPTKPRTQVVDGQIVNVDEGKATPIEGYKAPEPPRPNLSFQTVVPGEGQAPVIVGVDPKTGQKVSEVGTARPTGAQAKLTEAQEKSYLFYNLMKHAEPQITAALSTGRIRPAAVTTYLQANAVSDIPLVGKAIGAVAQPLANANLNAEEQQMVRAGKDFAAGVLRKESGAAVTNSELLEVMGRYFPGMFGDKPEMTEAKNVARQQYMRTMEDEASPAIQYYGRQPRATQQPTPDAEFDALMARYTKRP